MQRPIHHDILRKTESYTLRAIEDSRKIISNRGAAGSITFTLPRGAIPAETFFTFLAEAADLVVAAPSGHTLYGVVDGVALNGASSFTLDDADETVLDLLYLETNKWYVLSTTKGGGGGGFSGGTEGSVLFVDAGGTITEDPTNLFYDVVARQFRIGTDSYSYQEGDGLLVITDTTLGDNPGTLSPTGNFFGVRMDIKLNASGDNKFYYGNYQYFRPDGPRTNAHIIGESVYVTNRAASGSTTTLAGMSVTAEAEGPGGVSQQVTGGFFSAVKGNNTSADNLVGLQGTALAAYTDTALATGLVGNIFVASNGQTVGLATAIAARVSSPGGNTHTLTEVRGVSIDSWENLASIFGDVYGLYIDDSIDGLGASSVHPIYSESTNVSLMKGGLQLTNSALQLTNDNDSGNGYIDSHNFVLTAGPGFPIIFGAEYSAGSGLSQVRMGRDGTGNPTFYLNADGAYLGSDSDKARIKTNYTSTVSIGDTDGNGNSTSVVVNDATKTVTVTADFLSFGSHGGAPSVLSLEVGVAFGDLPTPTEGMIARITDSNTNVWGATIAGSGVNRVLAHYNGSNWTVMGK